MARLSPYHSHYLGEKRCGFLWLKTCPVWEIRKWVEDKSNYMGPSNYYAVVLCRCYDRLDCDIALRRFKENQT